MKYLVVKMRNKNVSVRAIVDDDIFEKAKLKSWQMGNHGYPVGDGGRILLHRFVMSAIKGQIVDHINGNKLDNRKGNLRFCNQSQNQANRRRVQEKTRSGLAGVTRDKWDKKWEAKLCYQYKTLHLGLFPTKELAHAAYKLAHAKLFKEFSPYHESADIELNA